MAQGDWSILKDHLLQAQSDAFQQRLSQRLARMNKELSDKLKYKKIWNGSKDRNTEKLFEQ